MADIQMATSATQFCVGYYDGNLSSNATSGDQTSALAALGLTFPNAFTSAAQKLDKAIDTTKLTPTFINFDTLLYGTTYIGIHWGNIPNPGPGHGGPLENNITAFYKFDAGTTGLDKIMLTTANNSISNAILYKTGSATVAPPVPEPATWAMMIGGFGLAGGAMRRRKTNLSFA